MKTIRIAIAGYGNVGRMVAQMVGERRAEDLAAGRDLRLVALLGRRGGATDSAGLGALEPTALTGPTGPAALIAAAPGITIEAGPSDYQSGEPAASYIRAALGAGSHVVVASKAALVREGIALRAEAAARKVQLRISAAAAAALPALDLLADSHRGAGVFRVEGILNATSNVLLTAMARDGQSFEVALSAAREAGVAEADHRNDTEGYDAAAKLLLLANFGLGLSLKLDDIARQDLGALTPAQFAHWRARGEVPKQVARLELTGKGTRAEVGIRAFPMTHPFGGVEGGAKAVSITSRDMGEVFCTGHGEEPRATAAAVLKDLLRICGRIIQA
jgi:homoserine dehydrogenase